MSIDTDRRGFIRQTALGFGALGAAAAAHAAAGQSQDRPIPRRPLGRTGEKVSIIGLGGWHLGAIPPDQQPEKLIRHAIDAGVNFIDNAWDYHMGGSEEVVGRALRDGYRDKVFLMTKHHGRAKKAVAMQHLEDSLRRLRTDRLDLWQFHEVIFPEEPAMIFSPGGAIEAAVQAKKEGKVRFIGFTGHKTPDLHKEMLAHDFAWDAVQMPVNVFDPHFRSFTGQVLPILKKRGIAVLAMKTLCGGFLLEAGVVKPEEALRWAWSQPIDIIISGMDSRETLEKNLAAARNFTPMSEAEQKELLARTDAAAQDGRFEPFKTSERFDGEFGRTHRGQL